MAPSSTSSSDTSGDRAPARPHAFFARSLLWLALILATVLGLGRVAGLAHRPQPLVPDQAVVKASQRFVVLYGNSLFEAAIDLPRLAAGLGPSTGVQMFGGGGWDALQYYMMALLGKDVLRSGRDAVVIEVSPNSLNDAQSRIGALRPEAAVPIATLPGSPLELRLDALMAGASPLYRYRMALQVRLGGIVDARLAQAPLESRGLLGPARQLPPYKVITAPDRNFVILEIAGDRDAFAKVAHAKAVAAMASVHAGGYKREALERTVRLLRERGLSVVLVMTPTTRWFEALRPAHFAAVKQRIEALAAETGATWIGDWPDELHDDSRYWDGLHMVGGASASFTDAVAVRLRTALGW